MALCARQSGSLSRFTSVRMWWPPGHARRPILLRRRHRVALQRHTDPTAAPAPAGTRYPDTQVAFRVRVVVCCALCCAKTKQTGGPTSSRQRVEACNACSLRTCPRKARVRKESDMEGRRHVSTITAR